VIAFTGAKRFPYGIPAVQQIATDLDTSWPLASGTGTAWTFSFLVLRPACGS
jgi:hypothetical protein